MFLVVAEHLAFARRWSGPRCFDGLRQSIFHFRQILNAVTQKRDIFSRGCHARNDVIAFPPESFPTRRESFLKALKISIIDGQRASR